ncbi:MAG: FAD-dependent oxidoreductase, partial [Planctomycetes bacterium]|nr:FAD-dependent oxidoreductase [Planctomycetota bacterium]
MAAASTTHAQEGREYDVVVYGGTSAGVSAAIQSARMGKSVVLIEPSSHIGGLTSGGLGWTDSGNKAVIGGISREFYQRVKKHYDQTSAWKHQKREQYDRYRPDEDAMWTFEPKVAEKLLREMLAEHKITVVEQERLDRDGGGVTMSDGGPPRILAIRMESGKTYAGKMFLDCTYEGDLMAEAGVSYHVGRESNDKYGETLNGVQKARNTHNHRFIVEVDPYVKPGDPESGLLHGIDPGPYPEDGAGDHRLQAYCFRMCMSNVPENRVPFPKPADYDEAKHELLLRNFEAGDLRLPLKIDMMPNGKTDTNNNCAVSTDYIGQNYNYPEAGYEEREQIIREHESYQKGLMWTLANHPRVPEKIRQQMSRWGLAADEFPDNGHWPHQIYVREARRMIGQYVMTEHDCRRTRETPKSVGMGSYNMDSHNCMRYVTADGHVQNEG